MIAKESATPETFLPHDKEAEQGVLGAIIHNNEAIYQAQELLTPEHFFSPAHREIFKGMLSLTEQQDPIDEITLGNFLRSKNKLDQVGGLVYLAELVDLTPISAHVLVYAEIVQEKYQLRSLINAATEIASQGREHQDKAQDLLLKAENVFLELATKSARRSYANLKDILNTNFEKLASQTGQSGLTGLPSGFIELDDYTNGLQPSDLIILAARPSMGKTSFALNIVRHAAISNDAPVIVFSLEMSKEQLADRLLCSEAGVELKKLRTGSLDDFEWDKLAAAAGSLSEAKIFIDETPEITPLGVKAIARRIHAEHGLGLIVVDYLQLMRANKRTDNREQEIAEISRSLKAVAKELNVPIIACAQLNRSLEQRPEKRPRLSDLRESGSIEQDADLVMFIYRDEVYNPETEDQGIAEIHISKHRNGPITTSRNGIRLAFIPEHTKFANLSSRPDSDIPYN
ncbi:MAG: replicative DNA helicase [Deltaproteobacteria bacterium]|nr:replicative DNA helicase [Deltaproteobacteria bacterium]